MDDFTKNYKIYLQQQVEVCIEETMGTGPELFEILCRRGHPLR